MAKLEFVQRHIDTRVRISNRDLIAMVGDKRAKADMGIAPVTFGFVEKVENHISSKIKQLYDIATSVWGEQIRSDFDCSWALNYRNSKRGRSNAASRTSKWRSRYELKTQDQGLCININSIWARMQNPVFEEYCDIRYDPQIGQFPVTNWMQYIEVLLCHEFAHVLELHGVKPSVRFRVYAMSKADQRGHGPYWQHIYRELRAQTGNVLLATDNPEDINKFVHPQAPRCRNCEKPFFPKRKDASYCSQKCRTAKCRKRMKALKAEIEHE